MAVDVLPGGFCTVLFGTRWFWGAQMLPARPWALAFDASTFGALTIGARWFVDGEAPVALSGTVLFAGAHLLEYKSLKAMLAFVCSATVELQTTGVAKAMLVSVVKLVNEVPVQWAIRDDGHDTYLREAGGLYLGSLQEFALVVLAVDGKELSSKKGGQR
nr:hypothetical protein CFP56_24264 [Quercus suber]